MKKLILFLIIPVTFLMFTSCDTSDDPITPDQEGNIFVSSNPAGAQIWLDGSNTFKTTADTIKNINEGVHSITLKLQDYRDTTFSISVIAEQTSVVSNVTLISNIITTLFGPVKIYETTGTSANQPSGLDLSTGLAYGVSSAQNGLVDIYYSSAGFLVQSADLYPNLIRETDFFVSSATNLFDGLDSPLRNTGTWTDNIGDRENNYVFLYDHDGNYSKLKIVNWGGGVIGEPAWVEVQWYYNSTLLDNRF
ncbi:MAG: PEGA domain-containing protein [Ignavibacteriales bacterium]|nr:PEGA domain-containing protein [Ignavibacteriales bacterium]